MSWKGVTQGMGALTYATRATFISFHWGGLQRKQKQNRRHEAAGVYAD
jgi:hypothetical protein